MNAANADSFAYVDSQEIYAESDVQSGQSPTSDWAQSIYRECSHAKCTSIGLASGNRHANDRRVVDSLAQSLVAAFGVKWSARAGLLVVRLDVFQSVLLERQDDQPVGAPRPAASPLGAWSEVTVPMPVGNVASWSLLNVPRWLPVWKSQFRFLLIDLGPIHLVPSRAIGRLCDGCYVILGPAPCASTEWLRHHIAWQQSSGSSLRGSIVAA